MGSKVKKLPDGWIIKQSTSRPDRSYYFNTKTGKSQWDAPPVDTVNKEKKVRRHEESTSKSETQTKGNISGATKISDKLKDVKKFKSKTPAQDRLPKKDALIKNKKIAESVRELVRTKSSLNKIKKATIVGDIDKKPCTVTNTLYDKTQSFENNIDVHEFVNVKKQISHTAIPTIHDEIPALFPLKTPAQDRLKTYHQKNATPSQKKIADMSVFHKSFGIGDISNSSALEDSDEKMDCDELMECDDDDTYSFDQIESMVIDTIVADSAYIVIDSNIFLESLTPIKQIMDNDQYSILLPFIVLQELDRKKHNNDDGLLKSKASSAIRYIYDQLKLKNHRFQGQNAAEDKHHIIDVTSPDDRILNCCLQLKSQSKEVILLTNDKNLGNKALVNGVETITSRDILVQKH